MNIRKPLDRGHEPLNMQVVTPPSFPDSSNFPWQQCSVMVVIMIALPPQSLGCRPLRPLIPARPAPLPHAPLHPQQQALTTSPAHTPCCDQGLISVPPPPCCQSRGHADTHAQLQQASHLWRQSLQDLWGALRCKCWLLQGLLLCRMLCSTLSCRLRRHVLRTTALYSVLHCSAAPTADLSQSSHM